MRIGSVLVAALMVCSCANRSDPGTAIGERQQAPESAEIVVAFGRDEPVSVQVGQTFRLLVPSPDRRWRIEYAADVLASLTPAAEMSRPANGWMFRAAAVGETAVLATPIDEPGAGVAPAPLRFTVTIKVHPK